MADLGLLQAWDMWWDNVQVNQHTLHGWSILALGRAGKVIAFLAGMTIVLDVIGPERLRNFSARYRKSDKDKLRHKALAAGLCVAMAVTSVPAFIVFWMTNDDPPSKHLAVAQIWIVTIFMILIPLLSPAAVRIFVKVIEQPKYERAVRWSAIALLLVGFHFDLLAS
ncbi:hypothetical protein GCM10009850_047930 [Nonomuraea monospora]|uniref:Uncharacterized protein n=1 Tax=Nonomuraea monospora TaxID=568818 RepID=A0ABN3CIS9_9ACTN